MVDKNELYKLRDAIKELKDKEFNLKRELEMERYENQSNLIGKCYKDNNDYYKIIDIETDNRYGCITLHFINENFDIEKMESVIICPCFCNNITSLGGQEIEVKRMLIKTLTDMDEISIEEFKEIYMERCEKNLSVSEYIKTERLKQINEIRNSYKKEC